MLARLSFRLRGTIIPGCALGLCSADLHVVTTNPYAFAAFICAIRS